MLTSNHRMIRLIALLFAAMGLLLTGCGQPSADEPDLDEAAPAQGEAPSADATPTINPAGQSASGMTTSVSPDGQWVAWGYTSIAAAEGMAEDYTLLVVERVDGSARWEVLNGWQPHEYQFRVAQPVGWSHDMQYFYWANGIVWDGCAQVFTDISDFHRVNLSTGEGEELLPLQALTAAMSPDGAKLAYVSMDLEVVLRDLASGEEQRSEPLLTDEPEPDFGHIVWSPDGSAVALTLVRSACGGPDEVLFGIVQVDTATMAIKVLAEPVPMGFRTLAWNEPDTIEVLDAGGSLWSMDAQTGEVTQ